MWNEHDNNQDGKLGRHKHLDRDRDVDINIDINIDGDVNFRPPFGGGARSGLDLNLCDVAKGIGDIVRDGRVAIGASAGAESFKDFQKTKEEPPFIDCKWDRMLDATKQEMVHKHARLGAALKDAQG